MILTIWARGASGDKPPVLLLALPTDSNPAQGRFFFCLFQEMLLRYRLSSALFLIVLLCVGIKVPVQVEGPEFWIPLFINKHVNF